jgi:tetratricopeptide (TPR) repeat protein
MTAAARRRFRARLVAAIAVMTTAATGFAGAVADPFYSTRLREGTAAFERGSFREAAESLRLACFGLLDEGPILVDCLVRLALARLETGDAEGFRETFQRIVEAEQLLGLYRRAELPEDLRGRFEGEVEARIPVALLAASPGFEHLAGERAPAERQAVSGEDAPAAAGLDEDGRRRLAEARSILRHARAMGDLERAGALVEEVLATHPGHREAELLGGEIAYRGSRWSEAVRHFETAGDPGDERCHLVFYYAVSLYESGRPDEAAAQMERCDGRLDSSAFVDRYRNLILRAGPSATGSSSR